MKKSKYHCRLKVYMGTVIYAFLLWLMIFIVNGLKWAKTQVDGITMSRIFFVLSGPLQGTGKDIMASFVSKVVFAAVIETACLICLLVFVYRVFSCGLCLSWKISLLQKYHQIDFSVKGMKMMYGIFFTCAVPVILLVIISGQFFELGGADFISNRFHKSTIYEEYYVSPESAAIRFPQAKRNLLLIYLESMESSYADNAHGGCKPVNYIPNLTELAEENICFSNRDKIGGPLPLPTEWTMAGLLASSSGVADLLPTKAEDDINQNNTFLPGLCTLGDVLYENGYNNYFLCGSKGAFGGRSVFYRSHGNYAICDLDWAHEKYEDLEYCDTMWGLEDRQLYDVAKRELEQISQSSKPFNFTMLTVDTHFQDGYFCGECRAEYGTQYENVICCADRQIDGFIKWVKEQDWYDNTAVVIVGDHRTMTAGFFDDISDDYVRTQYNCFINAVPEPKDPATRERQYSTMDFFPTILASMGVEIDGDRLGLGTNLYSGKPTLIEELGKDRWYSEIERYSKYYFDKFQ